MNEDAQLKMEVNELVWRNLPGTTTLNEAEEIAVQIFNLLKPDVPHPTS